MKVLLINEVFGTTSTGKICARIAEQYEAEGDEVRAAFGRFDDVPEKYRRFAVRIGTDTQVRLHGVVTRVFDAHGLGSVAATKKFLKWAEEYSPDLVWLHNIHGYYINYRLLFAWLKSHPEIEVRWTLHDCWAFTGHCTYFSMAECEKWQNGCSGCPQKKEYPASLLADRSAKNYADKKAAFCGVKKMTLITPSNWLAGLVKKSFLKDYPVEVVYNTIDTSVFKPTPSDFREKNGLVGKKVLLGVANVWEARKGLNDFLKLNETLDPSYKIVLVGLSQKQIGELPDNILGITRTNNASELAAIYTMADLFVNPSYEETFGLTAIEAQSCGTPAIVYKDTACEEVAEKYGGIVVEKGPANLYQAIVKYFDANKVKE